MSLTPTKFSWPAGPGSVQISGDWDGWKEKVDLSKKADGSFEKELSLPENKRIHFKFIVDGNWTTKEGDPTVDDAGNVNNIIDVGPAPVSSKADESGAAGVAGAAAAVGGGGAAAAAGNKIAGKGHEGQAVEPTSAEKKADPASAIKSTADSDVRSSLPQSLTSATHAAVPVLASAVATVTGADILRGNPEELPVSNAEAKAVQAQAQRQPSAAGDAITDPNKASSVNAKAGANSATRAAANNKLDAPVVAVGDAGFAANVDAARLGAGKQGGDAAGTVASAGQSVNNGTPAAVQAASPLDTKTSGVPAAADGATGTKGGSANGVGVAGTPAASAASPQKSLPSTPGKANAAESASTPGAKTAVTPSKATEAPSTPTKKDTVKDKKGTIRSQLRGDDSTAGPDGEGETKDRKRKQSIFGKIKSALSPHSSPSK